MLPVFTEFQENFSISQLSIQQNFLLDLNLSFLGHLQKNYGKNDFFKIFSNQINPNQEVKSLISSCCNALASILVAIHLFMWLFFHIS